MKEYKEYDVYRNTESSWTPTIPTNWKIGSLKWLSKRFSGGTPDKNKPEYWDEKDIPWLNSGSVNQSIITEPSDYISEEGFANSSAKWISKNSILVALAGQGKTKGTAAFCEIETTCNQSLAAITFKQEFYSKYYYWFLKSQYRKIRGLASSDGRDGLNLEMLGSIQLPIPSFDEQTLIARFLDNKTSLIDKLIEQKENILKLLTEKRTAIITQAVTKGLDPTVEMKDSGTDWLGEIPKGWKIKPLKFAVNLINEKLEELGNLTYLGLENIESWTTKRIIDDDATAEGVVTKFQPNDLLFGKLRPYLAKVYLADFEGGASTEALILRSGSEVVPAFLKYYLVSDLLIDVINSSSYGTKMPRASWNFMGRLPMVLPYIDIQNEIVEYLTTNISKFDISILKIKKSINQLKEYREALITSAVTGQIDIRKEVSYE